MRSCDFFDLGCHALNVGLGWWLALPWYLQLAIIVGIGFMAWGMIERAIFAVRKAGEFVHRIGGWPAVIGAALVVGTLVVSIFWPRGAKREKPAPSTRDKSSPVKLPKIGLPSGSKRVYDPDTNTWKYKP